MDPNYLSPLSCCTRELLLRRAPQLLLLLRTDGAKETTGTKGKPQIRRLSVSRDRPTNKENESSSLSPQSPPSPSRSPPLLLPRSRPQLKREERKVSFNCEKGIKEKERAEKTEKEQEKEEQTVIATAFNFVLDCVFDLVCDSQVASPVVI
jgi:hypothetical protein